jgi:hypothetical protein
MKSVDKLGLFWLPQSPEDSLSGRLIFDPAEGVRLNLVGTFDAHASDDSHVTIHGWFGSDRVTIDDAWGTKGFQAPGVPESSYRANRMLVGHHLAGDDLIFHGAAFRLSGLNSWLDVSGLETDRRVSAEDRVSYNITYTRPDPHVGAFSRGKVTAWFSAEFTMDDVDNFAINPKPLIRIEYDEPQPIETIIRDVARVQSLVIICTGLSVVLDELIFTTPTIKETMLDGSESGADKPIRLLAPPINYVKDADRKRSHRHEMLLTYDDLGGIKAVARWLDVSEKFERPLEYFVSILLAKHIFVENRFLNVTFAAEAFHRLTIGGSRTDDEEFTGRLDACVGAAPDDLQDWLREGLIHNNEPTLRKRLQDLARFAELATRPIIGKRDRWAYLSARVRNEITHIGASSRMLGGGDLFYLSESVFDVLRMCMLQELGVPNDTLAEKSSKYAITWYKDRLQEALNRLHVLTSSPKGQ